jgi:hypothetical protein
MTQVHQSITLSKMDAVRRQLNTAIELWFADGDPVSIHTLASASHDILHQLYKKKGLSDLLFDSRIVKDEHRKEWVESITSHYNFFKHGRKDIDKVIVFRPAANDFLIFFQIAALYRMKENLLPTELAFMNWYFLDYPHLINPEAKDRFHIEKIEQFRSLGKREFLSGFRNGHFHST